MKASLSKFPWKRALLWIIALYIGGGVVLYYVQERLIFHPTVLPVNYQYKFDVPFEELLIPVNKKEKISAVLFKADKPRGMVLYFHGNGQNIERYAGYMKYFTRNGYDALIMDYRQFGKSTGRLKEETFYADALQMYKVARAHYAPWQIVVYGKSLGTGIASQLASVRECKALVLETPYYSLPDVVMQYAPLYPYDYLMNFKFPTYSFIPDVKEPITIFHGTEDAVVPYGSAEKLKPLLKPTDEFITIPEGHHNGLTKFKVYEQKIDSILNN
ncbi:alpha/beta fold hydrolase [uncultured Chitinophaga sp.]|uniref:alpha/beta hydrolase n=1 Tax=uncultured Chitinophaga sp. TaxID=339340 RepID=UPI0025F680A8|nr:alpha/beta fold hydrolase [uncultured Chitinophaga sp.]